MNSVISAFSDKTRRLYDETLPSVPYKQFVEVANIIMDNLIKKSLANQRNDIPATGNELANGVLYEYAIPEELDAVLSIISCTGLKTKADSEFIKKLDEHDISYSIRALNDGDMLVALYGSDLYNINHDLLKVTFIDNETLAKWFFTRNSTALQQAKKGIDSLAVKVNNLVNKKKSQCFAILYSDNNTTVFCKMIDYRTPMLIVVTFNKITVINNIFDESSTHEYTTFDAFKEMVG